MLSCPRCQRRLIRVNAKEGVFYKCPGCHGRAVALSVARRVVEPAYTKQLWQRVISGNVQAGADCPSCRRAMAEVPLPLDDQQVLHLDVCARCRLLWFDPHEFEQMPARPLAPGEARSLVARTQRIVELAKAEEQGERSDFGFEPAEGWNWIPAMFGLPVEHDIDAVEDRPWYTWLFSAALVLAAVLAYGSEPALAERLGLIPAEAWRYGGLTFLTSIFLHTSLVHALGNAYFLFVFGDNVEDYIGSYKFLLLLILSALVSGALHVQADPHSTTPCVGASGAISAVIVFYALMYPRARLGIFVQYMIAGSWLNFPAYFGLICWLVFQSVMAYLQVHGASNVSAIAQLGGAGVGLCAWLVWQSR